MSDEEMTAQEFLQAEDEHREVEQSKLREGLSEPMELNKLEVFKEHIQRYFEISDEELENLKPREPFDVEVDLVPVRMERMGYVEVPTSQEIRTKKSVPKWARQVQCPKCGAIMTVIKAKRDIKFGENVSYQCHRIDEYFDPCLTVIQVTTDVFYWMRAGDFTATDWDWRAVAEETIPALTNGRVIDHEPEPDFIKPEKMPPSPWQKRVTKKVLWEAFWNNIMQYGEVSASELAEEVQEEREQDKRGKFARNLYDLIETLPFWMQARTGYVIKDFGNVFTVVGKAQGAIDQFPFSDENYRERHGF